VDFDWTLSPLDCDWTLKSGLQSSGSPVDWTGLDWTPVDWALYQSIWPGKMATGIHWSPLESTGVHMDYVGEGKDLVIDVVLCQAEQGGLGGKWDGLHIVVIT
jgi:hypothetical protein